MLGGRFGKYRILSELGSGGMATVYLGEAEPGAPGLPAGGRVAIKVVHSHLISKESIFQRFMREFDVGRQIHHPIAVRTLDAGFQELDGSAKHYNPATFEAAGRQLALQIHALPSRGLRAT